VEVKIKAKLGSRIGMSTQGTKDSMAETRAPGAVEETPDSKASRRMGEGLGVFRALLLTALFYISLGFLLWFAWHTFQHWRGY